MIASNITIATHPSPADIEHIWQTAWVPRIGFRAGMLDMDALKFQLYAAHTRDQEIEEAVADEMSMVMDEVVADRERTRELMQAIRTAARNGWTDTVIRLAEGWIGEHEKGNPGSS